jgi:uncharacterized repeat protein (TIGR03803 family)
MRIGVRSEDIRSEELGGGSKILGKGLGMRTMAAFVRLTAVLATFVAAAFMTGGRASAQEKLLHSFNYNGKDGAQPEAGLIFDGTGNLYGTTVFGGTGACFSGYGCGTVFQLVARAGGGWVEKVLHSFQNDGVDGSTPYAGLVRDASGNLYGTTQNGGTYGYGTVYELTPKAGGGWTESVLYSFNSNGTDGTGPQSTLILDAVGDLYGTAAYGGSGTCTNSINSAVGCGTVFELTPQTGRGWIETTLYDFKNDGLDGNAPSASLTFDTIGNLYGTTLYGGNNTNCIAVPGCGTVFELTPKVGGGWSETVLHNFDNNFKDGTMPMGSLVFDTAGNLYGTTSSGGPKEAGTIFELEPAANGGWTEKVIHTFSGAPNADGAFPDAGLIFDATGNLYGTTSSPGTVFELMPLSTGGWAELKLYRFNGKPDGSLPMSNLIFDRVGNLYGTTNQGGAYNFGTVFEIKH